MRRLSAVGSCRRNLQKDDLPYMESAENEACGGAGSYSNPNDNANLSVLFEAIDSDCR